MMISGLVASWAIALASLEPTDVELARAAMLIRQPAGTAVDWPKDEREFARLNAALVRVSLELEVLDKRETYFFNVTWKPATQVDLDRIRDRVEELADAPPMSLIDTWPAQSIFQERCSFNRRYLRWVEDRWREETDRRHLYGEVMEEANFCYRVNDLIRDARSDYFYVHVKRRAAKQAIALAGEDLFDVPAVPLWRFNSLR